MKYQLDHARIKAFAPVVDCEELEKHLNTWALICEGKPRDGAISQMEVASRFRWLTAARSTILQCSAVHPGLCTQPEVILSKLFKKYVA